MYLVNSSSDPTTSSASDVACSFVLSFTFFFFFFGAMNQYSISANKYPKSKSLVVDAFASV